MFVRTTVINKIKQLDKFVKGIQGGTSAGKTFGVLPVLIDIATKNKLTEISVVAESIPHLKRGAMKDFKKIMIDTNRFVYQRWNATDFKYTFANGSQIEFFSADNDSKLRGARRDYLYMNEANNMSFHAYTELASRTKQGVYLDWNPVNEFWFHTELKNDNDVDFLIVNYLDNEACPESALNFILKAKEKAVTSSYWDNWYKVYGLGEIGSLDGVIFNNWQTIDTIPHDARLLGYGVDFGYSNDPTAIVEVYKWNDKRIVNEICYEKALTNSQIAKRITTKMPVYCDSAEPKSIAELKLHGINAFAVEKGTDSIKYGINIIQDNEYFVTAQSVNLISELRKYAWDKDKRTGETLNKPIDDFNHCFIGETLITTINGLTPIKDIELGEMVLTSNGYQKVIRKFENGIKEIYRYSIQFDTFSLSLTCTDNHKIKTQKGWKTIKTLTENDIIYISEKDIIAKGAKECTLLYGNIITGKCQNVFMCITKTKTHITTALKTWKLLQQKSICVNMAKKGLNKIQSLPNYFKKKELQKHPNGTGQSKAKNGIKTMRKKLILETKHTEKESVKDVQKNTKQKKVNKNFVLTLVKLIQEEVQELITKKEYAVFAKKNMKQTNIQKHKIVAVHVESKKPKEVYDLMIENNHEYFANGILVHNCIDSWRYHEMMTLGVLKRPTSIRIRV